jgi:hypothetical protein
MKTPRIEIITDRFNKLPEQGGEGGAWVFSLRRRLGAAERVEARLFDKSVD